MAIAPEEVQARPLTYEEYLAEGEVFARYDIIDGVRVFMADPTRRHQRVLGNIFRLFSEFEQTSGAGQALLAPQDVLITRVPLRCRQPDVLFISHTQLEKCGPPDDPAPLTAPELVVEVLSPNEGLRARENKILDYCAAGVKECWIVDPAHGTVEVLKLAQHSSEMVARYAADEVVESVTFEELRVPVIRIFAP